MAKNDERSAGATGEPRGANSGCFGGGCGGGSPRGRQGSCATDWTLVAFGVTAFSRKSGPRIRGIARVHIDLAPEQLQAAEATRSMTAIHASSKAFKHLRAVVSLAHNRLGDETYRREDETCRDADRAVAGFRDARVMADMHEAVTSRSGQRAQCDGVPSLARSRRIQNRSASTNSHKRQHVRSARGRQRSSSNCGRRLGSAPP
jgi:hypothetical protein